MRREQILKKALVFDFPSLESHGVEVEPELAEMIRPAIEVEVLSKFGADLIPDCFELLLHVQPGGNRMVDVKESSFFQKRWKNRKAKLLYSSLKSADLAQLQKVLRTVAARCVS